MGTVVHLRLVMTVIAAQYFVTRFLAVMAATGLDVGVCNVYPLANR